MLKTSSPVQTAKSFSKEVFSILRCCVVLRLILRRCRNPIKLDIYQWKAFLFSNRKSGCFFVLESFSGKIQWFLRWFINEINALKRLNNSLYRLNIWKFKNNMYLWSSWKPYFHFPRNNPLNLLHKTSLVLFSTI